jgi:hypothetical protein
MKKVLVVLSMILFVGAFATPAYSSPQDKKVKTTVVAKDKKKATKAKANTAQVEAKSCCSEGANSNCAATCKEAASCKGEGMKKAEEKKK